ncbi:Fic/DOC family protein [Candidatus Magnetomonas plexicatena]|uniref:Fic/DOC family protein n=1 Tax=Candidatus Magnetomonas plexicatena TaxID=2552947 RepID=UPI001C7901FD|nr:cell filamentation protein Fic [Nitrospirales bacterium LBB_01]
MTLSPKYDTTGKDICRIHKLWLGNIYEWAGKYRQVNLSKGDFQFSTSAHIPRLIGDFEKGQLAINTPCIFATIEEIARAIATVHVELLLIHPFREGNGRVARLLADLMAMQADLPPLNYVQLESKKWGNYIKAIHAGMSKNYAPMTEIFVDVINQTMKKT